MKDYFQIKSEDVFRKIESGTPTYVFLPDRAGKLFGMCVIDLCESKVSDVKSYIDEAPNAIFYCKKDVIEEVKD